MEKNHPEVWGLNTGSRLTVKTEKKRSRSLSPLLSRHFRREKRSTKDDDGGHMASDTAVAQGALTPGTPGIEQQRQEPADTAGPDITITNAPDRRNGGNGSGSGSEASADSDQQGLVTMRETSASNNRKSGSEGRVSSGSSESGSQPALDRRSSNSARSSQLVLSDTPPVANQSAQSGAKTSSVSGRSKAERKVSSSSCTSPSAAAGATANKSSSPQTQSQQSQSVVSGVEKTRLQSAATQLKNFLAPNYKSRSEEFKKLFKPAENDKFVIDYSCAFQREILVHGRMYVSQHLLCFYANIFKWETTITIRLKDITNISKEKTAKVIPNALQFTTNSGEKPFFTSFSMRDKAYMMIFRIWQNALMDRIMHPADLYTLENQGYDEAEFSGSDHEAEDALAILEEESQGGQKSNDGDFQNLRRLAASAPHLAPVPPLTGLSVIDSIPGSEDTSSRSLLANDEGKNGYLEPKPRKVPRVSPNASSPGTAATTPAEEYTESENETEVNCPCTSHNGKEMLNAVFPISVDQLFLLLFTDSVFFRKFHEDRKTTDLMLSDWHVDKANATKSRQITYIVNLNHSVGPKSCGVTEKQTCTAMSKPGQLYVMTSEVSNSGIPYSDAFSIAVQYCLSRVSANQCRIRVHACIVYKKSCWGIVKSFIDKNALAGMEDYFADLGSHLHAECARFGLTNAVDEAETSQMTSARLRRQSAMATNADVSNRSPARKSISYSVTHPLLPSEIENIAKGILFVLVLMLLLNAALFYKLWYFESEAERGSFENSLRDFERVLQKSDIMPSEWLQVFQQMRFAQKKQLAKWLEDIDVAVKHLAKVQASLDGMRKQIGIMQRDFTASGNLPVSLNEPSRKEKEP